MSASLVEETRLLGGNNRPTESNQPGNFHTCDPLAVPGPKPGCSGVKLGDLRCRESNTQVHSATEANLSYLKNINKPILLILLVSWFAFSFPSSHALCIIFILRQWMTFQLGPCSSFLLVIRVVEILKTTPCTSSYIFHDWPLFSYHFPRGKKKLQLQDQMI